MRPHDWCRTGKHPSPRAQVILDQRREMPSGCTVTPGQAGAREVGGPAYISPSHTKKNAERRERGQRKGRETQKAERRSKDNG